MPTSIRGEEIDWPPMHDLVEYHGWVVLAARVERGWTDYEWNDSHREVAGKLGAFMEQGGHAVAVTPATNAMRTITLHGYTSEPWLPLLELFTWVGARVPDSYGEL